MELTEYFVEVIGTLASISPLESQHKLVTEQLVAKLLDTRLEVNWLV